MSSVIHLKNHLKFFVLLFYLIYLKFFITISFFNVDECINPQAMECMGPACCEGTEDRSYEAANGIVSVCNEGT